jgi:DivIVA domain-containing protein
VPLTPVTSGTLRSLTGDPLARSVPWPQVDTSLCKQGVRRSATGSHVGSSVRGDETGCAADVTLHDRHGLWPVARPSSYAPPVDGDEVRNPWFLRSKQQGYDVSEVDDLLRRVAAELDVGRPAGPLIENATFRRRSRGYDIDAVDWFFDRLLVRPGHTQLAGTSADPWRDLAVAQLTRGKVTDRKRSITTIGGLVERGMAASGFAAEQPRNSRTDFAGECANAWRDFAQQPGMHLRWGRAGRLWAARYELRTAEQQTIASRDRRPRTVNAGGSSFTYKKTDIAARSTADSWPPGIAELAARSWRDDTGHYAAETMSSRDQRREARSAHELVDETGIPILYASGMNYNRRACACVTFPDQRWLRFLVRGTESGNAVMTAVDQAGNGVARYRKSARDLPWEQTEVEITVHPDRELTDELVLAIAISAEWLESYFGTPGSAGAGAVGGVLGG